MSDILVPSKTFMVGEYLALKGGPAALVLTKPSFSIDASKTLHPDCMAARFWKEKTKSICNWGLNDPYAGKGGLGASSAEFLIAYHRIFGGFDNLEHVHQTYLDFSEKKAKNKPSGYDVLAQTTQECAIVESNPLKLASLSWSFSELAFILIHTGKKLKTHEHLQQGLEVSNWKMMAQTTEQTIYGLEYRDADAFVKGLQGFSSCLSDAGLVAEHTKHLLSACQEKSILAAKGCGAFGADVLFLVVEKEYKEQLLEKLYRQSYDVLATEADMFFENAKK